ncbi:hypothetical protein N7492_001099 [Penicillium capsulatum]|uniref:Uncharacterized protein n=1 Tax=Penicillium capsulatum TaxID=69766 RepID=A0A9W9ISK4_9EURO|nr:hypothetical protein N7492_001099 [Penicillium capsulatum]KAJ6129843.1 hypothetical protein N7512_002623 [Penicillium capsulatum]
MYHRRTAQLTVQQRSTTEFPAHQPISRLKFTPWIDAYTIIRQNTNHFANNAISEKAAYFEADRLKSRPHPLHEKQAVLSCDGEELLGLLCVDRQWLFAENMFPRLKSKHGVREVMRARRRDVNDIYTWILHQSGVAIIKETFRWCIDPSSEFFCGDLGGGGRDGDEIVGHIGYASPDRVEENIPSEFWMIERRSKDGRKDAYFLLFFPWLLRVRSMAVGFGLDVCERWLESFVHGGRALLVSSRTSALEIVGILADIQPGDEVIFSSHTYVTTANSFVLCGAVPVFVDLDEKTMNIDANQIKAAITPKTRAIVPVHYAGIACDMDRIMEIAEKHGLFVCEDDAMACTSTYKGRMLGTIAPVGCISFQEKKNLTAGGQGGAILINDPTLVDRVEVIYQHGTNRAGFVRGEIDQYRWLDIGVNATLAETQAAFLYAQIQSHDRIYARRLQLWLRYHVALAPLAQKGLIILPEVPKDTTHNANVFWMRVRSPRQRPELIRHLACVNIEAHAQFSPLHASPYGRRHGRFHGEDHVTSLAVGQIVILPLNMTLSDEDQALIVFRDICILAGGWKSEPRA